MLTEKKLLSDKSQNYMSDEHLAFFKDRLLTLKDQVEANLAKFRDTIAENEIEADPLDSACIEEIKQITLMGVRRDTDLLHQIEASIDRINRGEYGYCMETGEEIGLKRLLANPNATLSTEALQSIEQQREIQGDIL